MGQPSNEFLQCRQKLHSRVHAVVCGLTAQAAHVQIQCTAKLIASGSPSFSFPAITMHI